MDVNTNEIKNIDQNNVQSIFTITNLRIMFWPNRNEYFSINKFIFDSIYINNPRIKLLIYSMYYFLIVSSLKYFLIYLIPLSNLTRMLMLDYSVILNSNLIINIFCALITMAVVFMIRGTYFNNFFIKNFRKTCQDVLMGQIVALVYDAKNINPVAKRPPFITDSTIPDYILNRINIFVHLRNLYVNLPSSVSNDFLYFHFNIFNIF